MFRHDATMFESSRRWLISHQAMRPLASFPSPLRTIDKFHQCEIQCIVGGCVEHVDVERRWCFSILVGPLENVGRGWTPVLRLGWALFPIFRASMASSNE